MDVSQEAGKELHRKHGEGELAMSVLFFDRTGGVAQRVPRVTEEEAAEILDRLLAAGG